MYCKNAKNKNEVINVSSLTMAIKENINILEYGKNAGLTPLKLGSNYTFKEMDSVRIDPYKNIYYRHSTGEGGSIIDFVMHTENK